MNIIRWALIAFMFLQIADRSANAGERIFYRSDRWEVALIDTISETERAPYCTYRTTFWSSKYISLEWTLRGVDDIRMGFRLHKDNWNLPLGERTRVKVESRELASQLEAEAISSDELFAELKPGQITESWIVYGYVLQTAFNRASPQAVTVEFEGDEPRWQAPSMSNQELYASDLAFGDCKSALGDLHPSVAAAGEELIPTSPFKHLSTEQSTDTAAEPITLHTRWQFSEAQEDWGTTCYAETKTNEATIGFMGSPNNELVGFVEGVFNSNIRAIWQVDKLTSYIADGSPDDYFGWHSFYGLPTALLDEVAAGNVLMIDGGKKIEIDLIGAGSAIHDFKNCLVLAEKAPAIEKEVTNFSGRKKSQRSCLLEVDGRKFIDGDCSWGPYTEDHKSMVMEGSGYFAILYSEDDSHAFGYWNEEPNSGHAHTTLGMLSKVDGCWTNTTVRMCVGE
jgi:hypothetical protein